MLRTPAPIIVMTAAHDPAYRAAAVAADCYLARPFDLDELLGQVNRLTEETTASRNDGHLAVSTARRPAQSK